MTIKNKLKDPNIQVTILWHFSCLTNSVLLQCIILVLVQGLDVLSLLPSSKL